MSSPEEILEHARSTARDIVDLARQEAETIFASHIGERTEQIAERAAEKAIAGLFTSLGIDTSDPIEMQKDFAALRAFREGVELVKRRSIISIVTIIITGIMGILYAAFSHKF
jgi:hypothetical protein